MQEIFNNISQLNSLFTSGGILYIIFRLELHIQKTNMRLERLEKHENHENQ